MFTWIFNVNNRPHLQLTDTTVLFDANTIITIVYTVYSGNSKLGFVTNFVY